MVAFFASTILSVVALRFMPVVVTPLMLIRCYEQVKAGEELKLSHDWTEPRLGTPDEYLERPAHRRDGQ